MYRKQVNEHSPIRILEQSIHGGLGKGNFGVVMARAGVGKTACLVQIGLDDLMRERPVLHVALDQTIDHVQSWYDAIFEDLAIRTDLEDQDEVAAMIGRNRLIVSFMDHDLWPERLDKTVQMFKDNLLFEPVAILVDGYPWAGHSTAENGAMIGALKTYAKMFGAELWMTAQTHRGATGDHPTGLVPPCADYADLIDVAIFLEPLGHDVSLRLLKDHGEAIPPDTTLHLHPDTMRLASEGTESVPRWLPNSSFTLLSGAAEGAEAEFGRCAEKYGVGELNFSFDGRATNRSRGLVVLTEEELAQGAVSPIYMKTHMRRSYPDTPEFRRVLQSIWHQVNTAGEVFSVGEILDDGTVRGGTGWASELARHWHKPVHVYDQHRNAWFTWDGAEWVAESEPRIRQHRFAGTGTRSLSATGKKAIRELFERTFGDL